MASAFNAADIAAKKQELGYPADTTNVAYIEANHKLEDVIGAFNAFTGRNFVISFEENGLLFMGLTPLNQFNGTDKFVALSEIGTIAHTDEAVFNGRFVTDSETLVLDSLHGDHTENRLYTTSTLADWVAENVANVNAIIDGYNAAK